ncbi:flagellar brake protein [Clostridium botulinum]|uniref:flagellar brake protein n=1 Tax=Clostridium botulinum TaxID=1491 RepID=UPI0004D3E3AD|nr:flagellar brake domain-containing protein [Clostridium botulinum]KEI02094.1 flagellar protein [Clostridium botulinum C/D str. BKT75002]KEI09482.1 flagellar protein [Clostridium botulinum C/D str. BKT2873]MCD3350236.1 flagellar protein [Clostridium botulinum D/C]MCD3359174.1 flagellar protein [Clostridium botulinum D/C]MCD3361758.1 flagellar protein [Clostridium botulinum D/C]
MTTLNFKINNKVEIIDYEGKVYNSDIQDIKENCVAISIPIKDSEYLPLRKKDTVDVLYHDGNCIYSFSSMVVDRTNSNVPLIWVKLPKKFKKIQRRKFVRVSVLYKGKFAVVDRIFKATKESIKNIEFTECNIVDLSGGGMRIRTNTEIEKESIIVIILPMRNKSMLLKGEVKRIGEAETNYKEYGIGFIDMSMRQQDEIIKYVFTIMRKQMRKGLKEE